MRPFLVCIHDAAPIHAGETCAMLRDLAPLVGRRLSFAVVPDWHGEWPLAAHPEYCGLVRENAEELLLHGYSHRRRRGWGPATFLAEGSDEMGGLDADETWRTVDRGQRVFTEAFGAPARGFLAPAWQRGRVRAASARPLGVEHVVGFFALETAAGRAVRLTTFTWDCGRWGWLGRLGDGIGRLSRSLNVGVPTLAMHPRDLARGYWPRVVRLTRELLDAGYEPTTPARLLESAC